MPCRVLLMISSMRGGGSERQTLLLLQHLDRKRFTPHLYLSERAGDLLSQVPDDVVIHSFDQEASKQGVYYPGRILAQQVAHLRQLLVGASINVVYDRTFHMSMIAGPAAKRAGAKRVSTIVSPPHLALPMVESRFVWLKRRRLAKAYRQSKHVIAVSNQAAKSAETYYQLPADSVKVIVNPVDIQAIQQAAGATPAVSRKVDGRKVLVCVGRMTEEKGHRDLIDALALTQSRWPADIAPLSLRLIGDGPLQAELQSRATAVINRHEVIFLGTNPNPAPEILAADALILPSHFEGMPNVVLEAMALGTPVIATRAGGTVELERDQRTILWAEPTNPPSLADAILRFATDPATMTGYAKAASKLVMECHDVRMTTRRIEDLLESP
ncbi:MAG: glycosyltransferase [Pirellulaceae bacterium]